MAVYKNGKFYWFQFEYDGKRYRKSTKIGNRRAAEDIESAFRTALAKGDVGITEKKKIPSFKTAMSVFVEVVKRQRRGQSHATYRPICHQQTKRCCKHFQGSIPRQDQTPDEVEAISKLVRIQGQAPDSEGEEWAARPRIGNISPATVNRELACMRAVFNHVLKGDVLLRNPIRKSGAKLLR